MNESKRVYVYVEFVIDVEVEDAEVARARAQEEVECALGQCTIPDYNILDAECTE